MTTTHKKRILHLLVSDRLSGAENVAISIIENLDKDFDFLYVSKKGPIEEILKEKNINYKLFNKLSFFKIKRIIKEYNPDIIHAHDYIASFFAAKSGFKGKIVSHLHADYPFAKQWNLYTLAYASCVKKIDKIITVSNAILDDAVFREKIKNKTIVINNIIDAERIKNLAKSGKSLGESDIIFFGRLVENKDPLKFIEIIAKIRKNRPDIKAIMLGDGNLKEKCEEKIKEFKLENNITLAGFLENPYPTIRDSKCVFMPTRYEGLGLSAIESLLLEKPVYYYHHHVSGMADIFGEAEGEFSCKSDDDVVEKILKQLGKPKKPKINLEKFTNKKVYYRKIKELYES